MAYTSTKLPQRQLSLLLRITKDLRTDYVDDLKIVLKKQTLKQENMEPSKKNKPGPIVLIGIAAIVIAIISYFIFLTFFPELFQDLPTGEQQPIKK